MQSEPVPGTAAAPSPPERPRGRFAIFWFGAVPLLGFDAELLTGALSRELPLFPTWWHVGLVATAVLLNLLLHLGLFAGTQHLVARLFAIGGVAGISLLYALAEAPALPFMVVLSIVGLGLLAAAPYWALLGMFRLVPSLVVAWRAAGRSTTQLTVVLVGLTLLPTAYTLWSMRQARGEQHALVRLGEAMRNPARAEAVERLAVAMRGGDIEAQRVVCAGSAAREDHDEMFGRRRQGSGSFGYLADHAPFWFDRWFDRGELDAAAARRGFHRAHGVGWNDDGEALTQLGWRGGADLDWLSSRIEVHPEPDAALARVDWQFEVTSHGDSLAEARFELRLPPRAVASSLSSWIDGQERPAAFAARGAVQAAYDTVVASRRDPALLQELSPGRLRLLLFPLSKRLPAMRVRVGFTMPLRTVGERAELWLPQVVAHTCKYGQVVAHELVVSGPRGPEPRTVDDVALRQPLVFSRGAAVAQAVDHDGVVVQRLVPRSPAPGKGPFVVVFDASRSVAEAVADPRQLLSAFDQDATLVVFAAHGAEWTRCEATAGSPQLATFLAAVSCTGGVDARPALQAALDEAARSGVPVVHWLYGAAAALYPRSWPTFPDGVQIVALALHPGRNLIREEWFAAAQVVDIHPFGAGDAWIEALREHIKFRDGGAGDHRREFERRADKLPGVVEVSDHLARLWAAEAARTQLASDPGGAARLAARYRLATAGAGAVVLEARAQYAAAGLEPGALLGREPAGPIGGAPVPEWSTWLMVATGLAMIAWRQRGRRNAFMTVTASRSAATSRLPS